MVKLTGLVLVAALLLCATSDGRAQQAGSLAKQAVGTWAVASQYVEQQDGKKLQPFGDKPKGRVMYDDKGRFMLILQRSDLPRFASNNRMTGTPEEYKAIGQGTIAYFGTYTIDEKEGTITQRYEGSTYPNWDGDEQKRLISISGDELRIVSPVSSVGAGKPHHVLTRMK
jgi:hypothetical protein